MTRQVLKGKTALVTGASSGLGVDFARLLAEQNCNVILVARRRERLEQLAAELKAAHGIQAWVFTADLSNAEAPEQLFRDVEKAGLKVDVLINNAGLGIFGEFAQMPWNDDRQMLQVDIVALVHLTKLFLPGMLARNEGWILQLGSIGSFMPSPLYATYAATKAFVLSYGEALSYELRHTNVHVSVVCPGVTKTEFHDVSGQKYTWAHRMSVMESRPVAEAGIRMMLSGKPSGTPGFMNALTVWLNRFMPRRATLALAHMSMKNK